jgi:hypothetical protein
MPKLDLSARQTGKRPVCTENVIRIDLVAESLNVSADDRAAMLLSYAVSFAVQVAEPT